MPSTSTTTVTSVIAKVSQDIRGLLGTTGGDATILIDFTNRVHEDILRKTRWHFLRSNIKTFTTTSGVSKYYLGSGSLPSGYTNTSLALADIFTIDEGSVFDRTNYRQIVRISARPLTDNTVTGYSSQYLFDGQIQADGLELYPPPNGAYSIDFRYFKERTTLTAGSDVLQIPDDYSDVVVNGVAAKAFELLKMPEDAASKFSQYQMGIIQMISDLNLYPKSNNFIRPDA